MKLKLVLFAGMLLASAGSHAAAPFDPNAQPYGYVAPPALTSFVVTTDTETLYLGEFGYSTGNLHKYAISASGVVNTSDVWIGGAAAQIDGQNWGTERFIATVKSDGTKIPFRWASMSTTQQAYFGDATTGPEIVNYLRGDRSLEEAVGGSYRDRTTVLGDIIHSTPVYVSGTNPTVYVSANDGMVHAINASTGQERFAYVPSLLLSRLSVLSTPGYTHQYFNDGQMNVASISVSGVTKKILVGGMGGGGKGIFALDVTNPVVASDAAAAAKILWEISSSTTGFANLGHTYGRPILLNLPNGTAAALVGNGYNNSGNGHAVLYVINLLTGAKITEIDTGSGTTASPNGLSGVVAYDTDGDKRPDVAYAGDIDGNLWRFDLSANTASLLFTTSPAQAITVAPVVHTHPYGGYMVNFATGRIYTTADQADTSTYAAYGIWDGAPADNDTLLEQTQTDAVFGADEFDVRTASNNQPNWASGAGNHYGWKAPFDTEPGLRVVGDVFPFKLSDFIFYAANPVLNADGQTQNWVYRLNYLTGGANAAAKFDLNEDGQLNSGDHLKDGDGNPILTTDGIPVALALGDALRSQPVVLTPTGLDVIYATYTTEPTPPTPGGGSSSSTSTSSSSSSSTSSSSSSSTSSSGGDPGVSGGHFDFDIYCLDSYCQGSSNESAGQTYHFRDTYNPRLYITHVHQYDDIYDVTGVDMLNASQTKMNLADVPNLYARTLQSSSTTTSNGSSQTSTSRPDTDPTTTTSTTTSTSGGVTTETVVTTTRQYVIDSVVTSRRRTTYTYHRVTTVRTDVYVLAPIGFKVLVANQAYSPAAKVNIGGAGYVPVIDYGTSSSLTASSLPSYSLSTINDLKVNLPLDAFLAKDWGTGVVRAGLHPAKYSCVVSQPVAGPLGETRNGALTIQIVKDTITDADIQLNVAGRPDLGYRLKDASMTSKLVAMYTIFWHHPNNLCMGVNAGWSMAPPEEVGTDATPAIPAAGSTDPQDGVFTLSSSGGGSSTSTSSTSTSSTSTSSTSTSSTSTSSTSTSSTSTSSSGSTGTTGSTTVLGIGGVCVGGECDDPIGTEGGDYGRISWHLITEQ